MRNWRFIAAILALGTLGAINLTSPAYAPSLPSFVAKMSGNNEVPTANTRATGTANFQVNADRHEMVNDIHTSNAGIKVGDNPQAIAVDPNANIIYVTYKFSNKLSVINSTTDKLLPDIHIGSPSPAIAVNANTSQVFADIPTNNTVIAIDPIERRIDYHVHAATSPHSLPGVIFADTKYNKVYVVNQACDNISMINAEDQSVSGLRDNISTINVENCSAKHVSQPSALAFDGTSKRPLLYVANYQNGSVTVMDTVGQIGHIIANVRVGSNPDAIGVDSINGIVKVYVANQFSNNVAVIDASKLQDGNYTGKLSSKVIDPKILDEKFIRVGNHPIALAVDTTNHNVYVTNRDDSVSIINGKRDHVTATISLRHSPLGIAVNPNSHIVYVADAGSDLISVINGTSHQLVAGLNFEIINPLNSSAPYIDCKDLTDGKHRTFSDSLGFFRYPVDTKILCQAISNDNKLSFSSWDPNHNKAYKETNIGSQIFFSIFCNDLPPNMKNNDTIVLSASKYDTVTANFEQSKNFVNECANRTSLVILGIIILSAILSVFSANIPIVGKIKIFPTLARLSRTEILTIDGSVIVGVLILLSLQGSRPQLTEITASIVFPFAISVIVVLMKFYQIGKKLIITGFVNLMISIIILIVASYFQ